MDLEPNSDELTRIVLQANGWYQVSVDLQKLPYRLEQDIYMEHLSYLANRSFLYSHGSSTGYAEGILKALAFFEKTRTTIL